jgi:hypothetical protein
LNVTIIILKNNKRDILFIILMDIINKTINDIESIGSNKLVEKVNLIKELHNLIDKETIKYNKYIEELDNDNCTFHKKYKNYNINKLQDLINNENDINEMIKIYQTLSFKINEITNTLFNDNITEDLSSDTD